MLIRRARQSTCGNPALVGCCVFQPIVNIQVTREGSGPGGDAVTAVEKAALIAGVSQLVLGVLHRRLDSTCVVFVECEGETWGWGGVAGAAAR